MKTEDIIYKLFVNRSDVYAQAYFKNERMNYSKKENTLSPEIINLHLAGKITIGTYQLNKDNVKWACMDFDKDTEEDFENAQKIYNILKERGVHPLMEMSGGGDYKVHIWIFCECKANDIFYYLHRLCEELNIFPHEIFPKQNELSENKPLGSLVKLPLAYHLKSQKWSCLLNDEFEEIKDKEKIKEKLQYHLDNIKNDTIHIPLTIIKEVIINKANTNENPNKFDKFFNYILNASLKSIYFDLKDRVFAEVLDRFIHNNELKDLICVLLRNVGLPSKKLAAINAVLFFRSYILEGGYYPLNGMRGLTDALCNKYKEYGGTVLLSNEVKKIKVANNKVEGVIIESGDLLSSSNVISNCDVTLTYLNLIGEKHISSNLSNRLKKMIPTISTFIVFLGINKNLKTTLEKTRAFWFLDKPDTENNFIDLIDGKTKWDDSCIMISSPSLGDPQLAPAGKESIFIVCNASFQNSEFWTTYRDELFSCIVKKAENVIPGLSSCIETMEMATPQTFYKYTFNREGGIHGWASLTTQIEGSIISERSVIKGLFLAGHWITQAGQGGLPTAVQSGANVAKMILTDK